MGFCLVDMAAIGDAAAIADAPSAATDEPGGRRCDRAVYIPLQDRFQVPRHDAADGPAADAADRDRFARLVIPHLKDAYTLARWITGNRTDAEDVVQEACLRALRSVSTAADDGARTWMLAAVRNAAFAWLRKYRPAALVPPDELGPCDHEQLKSWDSDGETPEAALIAKTDAARLEAAIAALPAPFREALVLRDIQGLSYREIADVTGVPIGTVMSRLARGRARIIRIVGRHAGSRADPQRVVIEPRRGFTQR